MNRIYCNRGLTLIEMMIALALSLLIVTAAVSVFLGSKQTFRLEQDISQLQENFRFIADRFNKDFSMVGFSGCLSPYRSNTPTVDVFVSGLGLAEPIQGVEGGANPDSITVAYVHPESSLPIVEGGADRTSPLYVSRNYMLYQALQSNFASSATSVPIILLVGNCDRANLFLVTGAADVTTPGGQLAGSIEHAAGVNIGGLTNTSAALSDIFGKPGDQPAYVYQRSTVNYTVTTIAGVTGLYESRNGGAWELVLDNVTDMQVKYGIDSPASSDFSADSYQDWSGGLPASTIVSLKITLTMIVSQEDGVDVARDYSFTIRMRDMGI